MSVHHSHIPEKANLVLNLILITLILIGLRVWHLSVIQYEKKIEESRKPQRRVIAEPARRATIRDRFNLPLAINKVNYRASILYSQLRVVPAVSWTKDADGKKVKQYKRRDYIAALSRILADELHLDAERLEDLIHSKAALYYSIPFTIKEDLTEREYYRLKILEKDWPGIQVQSMPKRTYPLGKVGADIIGYMGAINRQEYEAIIGEMKALEQYLREHEAGEEPPLLAGITDIAHAEKRLKELQERAYTVNDYVGKTGIEGRFEADLRGFQGKKSFYSDSRGNFLRELPGSREPLPGNRFLLTISAELQEYAEKLLTQNERIREALISNPDPNQKPSTKQPWIKGGAILAMDPNTGEILAMASYPRFDPNDFISSSNVDISSKKHTNILRWLENDDYTAQIWDQKRPLERERYNDETNEYYDDELWMTWDPFLNTILGEESPLRDKFKRFNTIKHVIELQQTTDELLLLSGQNNAYWLFNVLYASEGHHTYGPRMPPDVRQAIEENLEQQEEEVSILKHNLDRYLNDILNHYDKVLYIDLCRVVVNADLFSKSLIDRIGNQSISIYRNATAAMASVEPVIRNICKELYHDSNFKQWRQENSKEFIKQKRAEEKQARRYSKPFIDYFDDLEHQLFQQFWNQYRWRLATAFLQGGYADDELQPYISHLNKWHEELAEGAHQALPWVESYKSLKGALIFLPSLSATQYLQTMRSFHELNRPLLGQYKQIRQTNGIQQEKHLAAAFYPTYGYGYGRSYVYRQAVAQGSLFKLVTAYAALVQRYNELEGSKITMVNMNPLNIVDTYQRKGKDVIVGYHANGTPIPQIYKGGRLAKSSMRSIGNLDILRALETSSNPYFSILAGDYLETPEVLADTAREFNYGSRTGIDLPGEIAGRIPTDLATNRTGLYSMAIGQHSLVVTALQSGVMLSAIANGGKIVKPKIIRKTVAPFTDKANKIKDYPVTVKNELFMPEIVRNMILEGMHRVMGRMHQNQLSSLSHFYHDYPEAISDYLELKDQLAGKTSTAESMERIDLDASQGINKYTHIWFGGIAWDTKEAYLARNKQGKPEIIVVVYLRFGKYGREAAPVAAQIIKKWHEIKEQR